MKRMIDDEMERELDGMDTDEDKDRTYMDNVPVERKVMVVKEADAITRKTKIYSRKEMNSKKNNLEFLLYCYHMSSSSLLEERDHHSYIAFHHCQSAFAIVVAAAGVHHMTECEMELSMKGEEEEERLVVVDFL